MNIWRREATGQANTTIQIKTHRLAGYPKASSFAGQFGTLRSNPPLR
jgi:hypothetical protein